MRNHFNMAPSSLLLLLALVAFFSTSAEGGMQQCYFCATPMECAQPLKNMAMVNCKRGCVTVFTDQSMTMATWRTCGSGRMCMNTPTVGKIPAGFMCACEGHLCNGHNAGQRTASIQTQLIFAAFCILTIITRVDSWQWS